VNQFNRKQWIASAVYEISVYADVYPGTFLIEDVKPFAARGGLETPPDSRLWGIAAKAAQAQGLIKRDGFGVDAYGSPKSTWRAAA
jgi:hypothetical protein